MNDRIRIWPRVVESQMKRNFLRRRIARDVFAGRIDFRQAFRPEKSETRIGRRGKKSIGQPDAKISGRARCKPTLEHRAPPLAHLFTKVRFDCAHGLASRMRAAFSKKSGAPKFPDFSASPIEWLPSVFWAGTPGSISGPTCKDVIPNAETTAPDVSPPATIRRAMPPCTSRLATSPNSRSSLRETASWPNSRWVEATFSGVSDE